jgi:hypothetical protein
MAVSDQTCNQAVEFFTGQVIDSNRGAAAQKGFDRTETNTGGTSGYQDFLIRQIVRRQHVRVFAAALKDWDID